MVGFSARQADEVGREVEKGVLKTFFIKRLREVSTVPGTRKLFASLGYVNDVSRIYKRSITPCLPRPSHSRRCRNIRV